MLRVDFDPKNNFIDWSNVKIKRPMTTETVMNEITTNNSHVLVPEEKKEEPKLTVEEIKQSLDNFSTNFSKEDLDFYKLAKLVARTTKHKRSSEHYSSLFDTFLMRTLQGYYPEHKDEIEKMYTEIDLMKKTLYKTLKSVKLVDNEKFIPALLGLTQGLL